MAKMPSSKMIWKTKQKKTYMRSTLKNQARDPSTEKTSNKFSLYYLSVFILLLSLLKTFLLTYCVGLFFFVRM